ncbi:MAG TPA: MFS transporter [Candidatus Polarisedimenticolia bacterium]|nr:MFS transporter [Candidatus Polarisedimenticolia bacterium]
MPDWRRNQLAITVSASMIFLGFTLVTPFLPFYIESIGVEGEAAIAIWSGLLLSITPLLAALLGPFWGRLADRVGMKIMVQRVLITVTIHWGLMFFTTDVWQILVLRVLLGLFSGFGTMSVALVTHGCPKERIGRAIGTLQAAQIMSTALGPLIGGVLAQSIGIRSTYLVTCGLCAAALCLVASIYRDMETGDDADAPVVVAQAGPVTEGVRAVVPAPRSRVAPPPRPFREILALPGFRPLLPLLFFANLVDRAFFLIVPLFLTAMAAGSSTLEATTGVVLSAGALAGAASAFLLGRIRRLPPLSLLFWSLLAGTALVFAMGMSRTVGSFALLRVLVGLTIGGAATLLYTIAGDVIPSHGRAASYGVLSSAAVLGGALGPTMSGLLSAVSPRAPLFAGGILYLALTVQVFLLVRGKGLRRTAGLPRPLGKGY